MVDLLHVDGGLITSIGGLITRTGGLITSTGGLIMPTGNTYDLLEYCQMDSWQFFSFQLVKNEVAFLPLVQQRMKGSSQ